MTRSTSDLAPFGDDAPTVGNAIPTGTALPNQEPPVRSPVPPPAWAILMVHLLPIALALIFLNVAIEQWLSPLQPVLLFVLLGVPGTLVLRRLLATSARSLLAPLLWVLLASGVLISGTWGIADFREKSVIWAPDRVMQEMLADPSFKVVARACSRALATDASEPQIRKMANSISPLATGSCIEQSQHGAELQAYVSRRFQQHVESDPQSLTCAEVHIAVGPDPIPLWSCVANAKVELATRSCCAESLVTSLGEEPLTQSALAQFPSPVLNWVVGASTHGTGQNKDDSFLAGVVRLHTVASKGAVFTGLCNLSMRPEGNAAIRQVRAGVAATCEDPMAVSLSLGQWRQICQLGGTTPDEICASTRRVRFDDSVAHATGIVDAAVSAFELGKHSEGIEIGDEKAKKEKSDPILLLMDVETRTVVDGTMPGREQTRAAAQQMRQELETERDREALRRGIR